MIVLNATDTLAGGADAASQVTLTVFGMTLLAGVETYDLLYQGQLAAAPATIYTTPASTQAFIKSVHVVNTDVVPRSFQLFANGTGAANAITTVITLAVGGMAVYGEHGWRLFNAQGELFATLAASQTGRVTSDQATSTIALSDIAGLSNFQLAAGKTYRFVAMLFCTSNAASVGIHHGVNFTGTVTYLRVGEVINPVTAPTPAGSGVAFGVATAIATKIISTTAGPGTTPVLIVVVGVIEVGASGGVLSFQHGSETATATTTLRGSHAEVSEIA